MLRRNFQTSNKARLSQFVRKLGASANSALFSKPCSLKPGFKRTFRGAGVKLLSAFPNKVRRMAKQAHPWKKLPYDSFPLQASFVENQKAQKPIVDDTSQNLALLPLPFCAHNLLCVFAGIADFFLATSVSALRLSRRVVTARGVYDVRSAATAFGVHRCTCVASRTLFGAFLCLHFRMSKTRSVGVVFA